MKSSSSISVAILAVAAILLTLTAQPASAQAVVYKEKQVTHDFAGDAIWNECRPENPLADITQGTGKWTYSVVVTPDGKRNLRIQNKLNLDAIARADGALYKVQQVSITILQDTEVRQEQRYVDHFRIHRIGPSPGDEDTYFVKVFYFVETEAGNMEVKKVVVVVECR